MAFQEEKTQRKLKLLREKEEEESIALLSQKYRIPAVDLTRFVIETDALRILPEDMSKKARVVVFQSAGKAVSAALRNPETDETNRALSWLESRGYRITQFLASQRSLEHAWELYQRIPKEHKAYAGAIQISEEKIAEFQKEIQSLGGIQERVSQRLNSRTTEILEILLAGALATDASDIHMEPQQEDRVRVRMRLDGVLYDAAFLPAKTYALVLSRIKLVSELKLNVRDRAQDGRFTIRTPTGDIEVRVSTLPGPQGENTVLRVLNPKSIGVQFPELGLQPWVADILEKELEKPNGMIVTTGPTGSGKTTTLYTFLKKIHSPSVKIITIEDPIEYHLSGVEQTQVDSGRGYDFANGLRAIVRQDPDIILVGEIRDLETAETAMHASLTGHLVFSTLHTNNAAGTIPRLLDLGVKPSIIAPAINVALAQRLVRKLCPKCREPSRMSAEEKKRIHAELKTFPSRVPAPNEKSWAVFRPGTSGCDACNGLGYKGRIGIFEMILIDDEVERLIAEEPSEYQLVEQAKRQGQITMRQDGLLKALSGVTDFEEVERIIGSQITM